MPLTALPAQGNTAWYGHYSDIDKVVRAAYAGWGIHMDDYTGTDEQQLTAAISAQQADTARNMPPIILASRDLSFTTPREWYSGCKIIGPTVTGQKNPEINTNYVGPSITLGGSIGTTTASWWNWSSGTADLFDVFMSDFSVRASDYTRSFADTATRSLYACVFNNLSFDNMFSVLGGPNRKFYMTQVNLTGTWTINNLVGCQMWLGGSDNTLWKYGYVNLGTAQDAAHQKTTLNATTSYYLQFNSLSNTEVGYIYASMLNGWRGIKVSGTSSSMTFFGGVYEGYKPSGTASSGGTLAAPGACITLAGGNGTFYSPFVGQGMAAPDASENGLVQVQGGEWAFYSPTFYGANMATANAIHHTGGRLVVLGGSKRQNESGTWANRPLISTSATAGSGSYTYYSPDQSMG